MEGETESARKELMSCNELKYIFLRYTWERERHIRRRVWCTYRDEERKRFWIRDGIL